MNKEEEKIKYQKSLDSKENQREYLKRIKVIKLKIIQ